jgi:hypothetical protein
VHPTAALHTPYCDTFTEPSLHRVVCAGAAQLQSLLALAAQNNIQQALGMGLFGQQLLMSGGLPDGGASLWSEPPPAGCDQDTFKLFVVSCLEHLTSLQGLAGV